MGLILPIIDINVKKVSVDWLPKCNMSSDWLTYPNINNDTKVCKKYVLKSI
jgi:hypothetical protein